MKRILSAVCLLATFTLVGCVSTPEENMFYQAKSNFEYVPDQVDEWKIYDSINTKFSGDCEDFAFTLQKQIGGEVFYAFIPSTSGKPLAHAVLVKNGIVYDNNMPYPMPQGSWNGKLGWVMNPTNKPNYQ